MQAAHSSREHTRNALYWVSQHICNPHLSGGGICGGEAVLFLPHLATEGLEGILYASSSAWAFGALEVRTMCYPWDSSASAISKHGAASRCCAELVFLKVRAQRFYFNACAVHEDPWQSEVCTLGIW